MILLGSNLYQDFSNTFSNLLELKDVHRKFSHHAFSLMVQVRGEWICFEDSVW